MPSFRRRASVLDAERVEKAQEEPDRAAGVAEAKALAEEAEPDSATALDDGASTDEADDEQDGDAGVEATEETARKRRRWLPRPSWKRVAVGLAILCICALLAASGCMVWQHRQAVQEQQRSAEFAAAGKQSVVTLMSLNFNRAQEDVQRIIDNSTGQFKDEFQNTAEDFVKVAQDAKVTTEVTVNSTAVESMTDDSAVVLVSATSRVTNNAGAQQEPRSWRLSVNLQREGGQIKMSKVEFVP